MHSFEQLQNASDRQLIDFAASYGMRLTLQEVKILRPILSQANISWLLFGIPAPIKAKIEKVVGKDGLNKLEQILKGN